MIVALVVAALVALFLGYASTRPAEFRVERALELSAPPAQTFAVVSDEAKLRSVYVVFGDSFEKSKGQLTIESSTPGESVKLRLLFTEPMESKATVQLALVATSTGGTRVTWTFDGKHNFLGKVLSVLMNMDKAVGGDIEKSLQKLKTVAEARG
ncbi:MAG: SRPBCC family protein [Archangium sp.]